NEGDYSYTQGMRAKIDEYRVQSGDADAYKDMYSASVHHDLLLQEIESFIEKMNQGVLVKVDEIIGKIARYRLLTKNNSDYAWVEGRVNLYKEIRAIMHKITDEYLCHVQQGDQSRHACQNK
ncbi:unnamed protein product, partial [marine sediment metagenome]